MVAVVELARSGTPSAGSVFDHPTRRIPALTRTGTGRLLAAWDIRQDWRDLPGPFDIVVRHSDDDGRTWGGPRTLRAHSDFEGFGDASLLAGHDMVWCFYTGSRGASFFDAQPSPSDHHLDLWLASSEDDGLTWSHRRMNELRPAGVAGMFTSSGCGTVLDDGRLLQPFVLRRNGHTEAAVARSDDRGGRWALGATVGQDCDETKVIGLGGGRVLLHARAAPRRRQALSHDGGETFDTPRPRTSLVDPGCNGGLARLDDGTLVASGCDDPGRRRRLTLRFSTDEGMSWGNPLVVDPGACAYSTLTALPGGGLAVIWESGDYDAILFASLSAEELGRRDSSWREAGLASVAGCPGEARPPVVNSQVTG